MRAIQSIFIFVVCLFVSPCNDMFCNSPVDSNDDGFDDRDMKVMQEIININKLNVSDASTLGRWDWNKRLYEFNFADTNLKKLPESIGTLGKLERIYIVKSGLTYLPESIGNLTNLTEITILYSKLETLPNSISRLKNLKSIDLSFNRLTEIPSPIFNTTIGGLNVSGNNITNIGSDLGKLSLLGSLNLSYNKLTTLPEEIGNLQKLDHIYIYNNNLVSLPNSLWNIKSLTFLRLDSNAIDNISERIGELTNLDGLLLEHNNLKTIPDGVGNLKKLFRITLAGNYLYCNNGVIDTLLIPIFLKDGSIPIVDGLYDQRSQLSP
ncbi:MAG: hypothetical protein Q8L88_00710 [Bacteroidota bacterium]|nr:hypothetical protein [Bacteroidota bacterium]